MARAVLKSEEEIKIMREGGKRLFCVLEELKELVLSGEREGDAIDAHAKKLAQKYKGTASFKGYRGFPAHICFSVNDEVVHGIPYGKTVQDGDMLKLDFGFWYKDLCTDSAVTLCVGDCSKKNNMLMNITKRALYNGIDAAKSGSKLGDIGYAIQSFIERHGFSVVKKLVGHGVGKEVHEPPQVPNYGSKNSGLTLKEGMTLAIEPMVNAGNFNVFFDEDGWTVKTVDSKPSAHFEHTIAITKKGPLIITAE